MLLFFIILYRIIHSINAQLTYASVHYIYVQSAKTWDDAVQYCSDNYDGLSLATISDFTDNLEISSLLAAYGNYGTHAWIGLHYWNSAWRWVDNTVSSYRRWDSQSNQPQILQCAKYAHSQNVDNTYWLTDTCQTNQHFICNYQNPSSHPTNQPTLTPTSATIDPTSQPTLTPTINPTSATIDPTNHPTISPTEIPTEIPTNNPTLTDSQTSTKPSQRPTVMPTKYDDVEIDDETTAQYLEYEVTIKLENAEQLSAEQLNEIVGDILTLDNVQNAEILQVDGDEIVLHVTADDELDSDMIKNELIDDYPEIEVEIDDLNDKKIKKKDDSIVVVIMIVCIVLIICVVLIVVLMKTKTFVDRNKPQTKLVHIGTKSTDNEHNHNGELERIQSLSIEMVTKGNDEDDIVLSEINNTYEDIQATQGQEDDVIEGKRLNEYDMNTNIENDEFVIDDEQSNKITRKYPTNNGLSEDKETDNGLNEFVIDGEDENQVTNNGLNQDEFVVNENDHKTKKYSK